MEFFKFPKTPHLFSPEGIAMRNDKVLTESEADLFLSNIIVVEEKVDGANIGISFSENGQLNIQNRGNYIAQGDDNPQFTQLWNWLYSRMEILQRFLPAEYILFGEWCFAKHSIHYTNLQDWFLAFDIFDKKRGFFPDTKHRNQLLKKLDVEVVPIIGKGRYLKKELEDLLYNSKSLFYPGPVEGIYLRYENAERLLKRSKLVRNTFIQNIHTHWSKEKLIKNELKE